jgi:hypothetical protein
MCHIHVYITFDELKDLLMNLDQCESEGYLNFGDPCYSLYGNLKKTLEECEKNPLRDHFAKEDKELI